jgi:hypothetical protein
MATDLDALWAWLPEGFQPADVTVVMEPTRIAWVALAAWSRQEAHVVLGRPVGTVDTVKASYPCRSCPR